MNILHDDVGDGQLGRELIASGEVLLTVALGDLNSIVDVVDGHGVVSYVVDTALTTTALEVTGKSGG